MRGLKHKNVAAELLEKLLKDELKVRFKRNLVQSQVFSEKLKKTLNAYHNRAISTMQVVKELIKLAKDLDAATKTGKEMGLSAQQFMELLFGNPVEPGTLLMTLKAGCGCKKLRACCPNLPFGRTSCASPKVLPLFQGNRGLAQLVPPNKMPCGDSGNTPLRGALVNGG